MGYLGDAPVSESGAPAKPPRISWRCPLCKRRLWLRWTTEDEAAFRKRCDKHARTSSVCRAALLLDSLRAEGLQPLRQGMYFTTHYELLKDAGLTTKHLTHVDVDCVQPTPWAPAWAVQYAAHLRTEMGLSYDACVAELRAAAESPDAEERVRAFLLLAQHSSVDERGEP